MKLISAPFNEASSVLAIASTAMMHLRGILPCPFYNTVQCNFFRPLSWFPSAKEYRFLLWQDRASLLPVTLHVVRQLLYLSNHQVLSRIAPACVANYRPMAASNRLILILSLFSLPLNLKARFSSYT